MPCQRTKARAAKGITTAIGARLETSVLRPTAKNFSYITFYIKINLGNKYYKHVTIFI